MYSVDICYIAVYFLFVTGKPLIHANPRMKFKLNILCGTSGDSNCGAWTDFVLISNILNFFSKDFSDQPLEWLYQYNVLWYFIILSLFWYCNCCNLNLVKPCNRNLKLLSEPKSCIFYLSVLVNIHHIQRLSFVALLKWTVFHQTVYKCL